MGLQDAGRCDCSNGVHPWETGSGSSWGCCEHSMVRAVPEQHLSSAPVPRAAQIVGLSPQCAQHPPAVLHG